MRHFNLTHQTLSNWSKTVLRTSIILLFIAIPLSAAEKNHIDVSAVIRVHEPGKLYIYLVDREQFSTPHCGMQKRIISISKGKTVKCIFDHLPPGEYGIRAFLDQNDNGKLDRGLMGPKEPWGMSFHKKRSWGIPRFENIRIDARTASRHIRFDVK